MSDMSGSGSDNKHDGIKPEDVTPDAELLGPERNKSEQRPPKEPKIIEGVVEGSDTPKPASSSSFTKPEDKPKLQESVKPEPQKPFSSFSVPPSSAKKADVKPRSSSNLPLVALGCLVVLAAGAIFYFANGSARLKSDLKNAQTRIATLESNDSAQTDDIRATEKKLDTELAKPSSASSMAERLQTLQDESENLKDVAQQTQAKLDDVTKSMPPADIAVQVSKLESMLGALGVAIDSLGPKVAQMEARVAALEAKKDDPDASGRAALGLALANLARASESAAPFKRELDAIAVYLPHQPQLAELGKAAATGVPTKENLKARFPQFVKAVTEAERLGSKDGFWARLVANARSMITVRRTGEISGTDTEAVLARMEERLKQDDLPAALREAMMLRGVAATAGASWITEAEARVRTDLLLRDLSAQITERLSRPADAKPVAEKPASANAPDEKPNSQKPVSPKEGG